MEIKIKPLHKALLTLEDGRSIEVERIGRGRYTTAWANGTSVYLQTRDTDASKEILANLNQYGKRNPHIPECVYLGPFAGDCRLYTMPKYRKLRAGESRVAWKQYRHLAALRDKAGRLAWERSGNRLPDGYDINGVFRELVENDDNPALPEDLREAVLWLVDEAADYGEYCTEFTVRNLAVDKDGTLILLDPLFDMREVREAHKAREKRARGY